MARKTQKTETYTDYRGQFQSDGVWTPDYYDVEMGFDQPYMNKDYSDYYGYPYETTEYFPTEKTPQRDILEHSSKNGVNRQVISSYVGDKSKNYWEEPTVPVTKSDTTYIIPSSMGGFLSSGDPDQANSVQYKVLRDKYNGAPGGLQGQTYFSQGYAKGGYLKKFQTPAGKLKHDYDGYEVLDSYTGDYGQDTEFIPQNGEDFYFVDSDYDGTSREYSRRNGIYRSIYHAPEEQSDTVYTISPMGAGIISSDSPEYQNYADQYNHGKGSIMGLIGNKVRKLAKRFLPWEQHGGRLPLLKRQGGRIINVYY